MFALLDKRINCYYNYFHKKGGNTVLKIGFIGCGNMGGALACAAAKSGNEIFLADFCKEKAEELAKTLSATATDNISIAKECDFIFLGVKPQVLSELLKELAPTLAERESRFLLVSMAAGVTTEKILSVLGADYPIIRIMPNTPVAVGGGMILYTLCGATAEDEKTFLSFMAAAGRFDNLPETLIDAGSALSGCGPAFVCQFIEALADGGVSAGLPRDKALLYAAATLEGTAQLMLSTGKHPAELKDSVCSPGGSTIQGVRRLEQGAFRADVIDAVIAAYQRTKELGK